MWNTLILIFSLLVITGCDAVDSSKIVVDPQTPTNNSTADYKGLTSDYLVGEWCYSHYQSIDPSNKTISREVINQNFIFSADGSYVTQQDSDAPMTTKGIYEFLPQGIFKLIIGKATVVSVNPDNFILHKTLDHFFYRGICQ
jgi:hypothetical protein